VKIKSILTFILLALRALSLAHAQNTVFTYQGRVLDNGTNFNGTGQFKFALGNYFSRQATAGIYTSGGANGSPIKNVILYDGGIGYTSAPVVTISGPGSGAMVIAEVGGGSVTNLVLTSAGSGYLYILDSITIGTPQTSLFVSSWNNDGATGSEPLIGVPITVTNGLFTVVLGDTTLSNMMAIPASLFAQNSVLQIWFNDGVHGFAALNPVQPLTPAPTATFATTASNLLGTLPTSQLSGIFFGDGSGLTSLSAQNLAGPIPPDTLTSVPAGSLTGSLPAAVFPSSLTLTGGLNLDNTGTYGANPGTVVTNALVFGTGPLGSGEGITSKRVGVNPYDLEFFTGFKNRITISSAGNVGIGTTNPAYLFEVANNGTAVMTLDSSGNLECSGTVYSKGQALTSDRNLKENFTTVDNQAVLAKVAALPMSEWNYKSDSQTVQHLGPMAQDFHAAFGLDGADDKHISMVDEGGVALAAIQGLNQKVEEKDAWIQEQESRIRNQAAEITALKQRLNALEKNSLSKTKLKGLTHEN
jgi:hypothetical protein